MLYSNSSLFEITLTTFPTIFWVTYIYWVGLKGAVKMIFELDPFATLFYLFGNINGKIFTSAIYVMLLLGGFYIAKVKSWGISGRFILTQLITLVSVSTKV